VRPKRRGRKHYRSSYVLPTLILLRRHTIPQLTSRYHASPAALRYRAREAMRAVTRQAHQLSLPDGDLVLLVDGLWSTFQGEYWVLYDMAVKSVAENMVYFLDPVQRLGREGAEGWQTAVATLPPELRIRVKAMVSDGLPCFEAVAQRNHWLNQFCHWHLRQALESKLGRHRRQLGSRWLRERIYQAVCEALKTSDAQRLEELSCQLQHWVGHWDCTRRLRWVVNQFLRRRDSFRTYLDHPDLGLPTTVCSLESMHHLLRGAIGSVNNPQSLLLRATTFLRFHPTLICNASSQQN
jgi:hypothetical protein